MKSLLAIEWLKVKKYTTFWVLAGLFTVLLFAWNYMNSSGLLKLAGPNNIGLLTNAYKFPEIWDNVAHWTKFFSGLVAIVIIILTTNEYQYRTNRQNVIDGWSRSQFYNAKWLLVLVMTVLITFYTFLLVLIFALANGSSMSDMGAHAEKLLYVMVMALDYFSFALTLSFFFKRSGMTIVIFLLYTYIIEIIFQQLLNWKIAWKPGNYLPLQCSAELLPFPLLKTLKSITGLAASGPTDTVLVITTIAWIIIYYFIGRAKLLRSDW